jgi:hypothetical protein
VDPTFDRFDYQTVERPDARRYLDDTRRAQPYRWPNGMTESYINELRGKTPPVDTLHTGGESFQGLARHFANCQAA